MVDNDIDNPNLAIGEAEEVPEPDNMRAEEDANAIVGDLARELGKTEWDIE